VTTGKQQDPLQAAASKAFAAAFGGVLKLAPDLGAPVWIDGRDSPPKVLAAAPDKVQETCVWRGTREALVRSIASARAFESAYVSGRICIAGDISVAARIILDEHR
jgi:hypothetical protein